MSTSSSIIEQRAAPRLPTRWQRMRVSSVLRASAAAWGLSFVPGDMQMNVGIAVGAVLLYWHGVDAGRLEREELLDQAWLAPLMFLPAALAVLCVLPPMLFHRAFVPAQIGLPAAVGLAALQAGMNVASDGWRWGAFAREWLTGSTGWVAVAVIAVCGVVWGGEMGGIEEWVVMGALVGATWVDMHRE